MCCVLWFRVDFFTSLYHNLLPWSAREWASPRGNFSSYATFKRQLCFHETTAVSEVYVLIIPHNKLHFKSSINLLSNWIGFFIISDTDRNTWLCSIVSFMVTVAPPFYFCMWFSLCLGISAGWSLLYFKHQRDVCCWQWVTVQKNLWLVSAEQSREKQSITKWTAHKQSGNRCQKTKKRIKNHPFDQKASSF